VKLSLQRASQRGVFPYISPMIASRRVTGRGYGCNGETRWLAESFAVLVLVKSPLR
jgi:hypothetical protein